MCSQVSPLALRPRCDDTSDFRGRTILGSIIDVTDPAAGITTDEDLERAAELVESVRRIRGQVARAIVGQDTVIEQLIIAILARGHCLLQGVPGLAKTLMVR